MNEQPRLHTLPVIGPEEVGLAAAGLDRLSAVMQREVDTRHVPGISMLIARGGKAGYRRDFGALRPGGPPLPGNAIFRIYSMTKPIVTVALLMLVEEGRLFLADPITKFVPELTNLKVGVEYDGKLELVAAKKPITIQDLLRHTSGLTYAFTGNSAVQRRYGEANLFTGDPANSKQFLSRDLTTAEFIAELAKLPLIAQPGDSWDYGHSTDVIGRVIEVVSGQTLGAFLDERIFEPLGMSDSAFFVPAQKYERLAEPFPADPDGGPPVALIDMRTAPRFESGGGGLFSTMDDYARFAQMLFQGGIFGGTRIAQPQDARVDDVRSSRAQCPHRHAFPAAAGTHVRAWIRHPARGRYGTDARHSRRVFLGRRGRHLFLGGAEGRAVRADDGPGAAAARPFPPAIPHAGLRRAGLSLIRKKPAAGRDPGMEAGFPTRSGFYYRAFALQPRRLRAPSQISRNT